MNEQQPKFPDVHVQLSGEEGNVFSIIGRVRSALMQGGATDQDLQGFWVEISAAISYDDALRTIMRWVETS